MTAGDHADAGLDTDLGQGIVRAPIVPRWIGVPAAQRCIATRLRQRSRVRLQCCSSMCQREVSDGIAGRGRGSTTSCREARRQVSATRGREGMSAEQVLRALVVKQLGGFSYDELAFQLADSNSYRAFCRFEVGGPTPNKKTLQRNIKKVKALTLERINVALVEHALGAELDDGNKIRVDCTVVETNIHDPTDSSLLLDSVRVLVRLMSRAQEYVDAPFTNHHRHAATSVRWSRSRRSWYGPACVGPAR
jgi:IS5 family transposase